MTSAAEARRSKKAREGRRAQDRRRRERLREKTRQLHAWLIDRLGGKCVRCGDYGVNSPLTVEHVKGITWRRRKLNPYKRVLKYIEEYERGVPLAVLCFSCNSAGGNAQRGKTYTDEVETLEVVAEVVTAESIAFAPIIVPEPGVDLGTVPLADTEADCLTPLDEVPF